MESKHETFHNGPIELLKICRMCLKKEKILKSMFHCSVNEVLYSDIYENCTGFKITSSVCTSSICTSCETDLLFVYEFKQKIQENEEKLEQLIEIKKQNDHSNHEIENQFLLIDDNFLDYQIESIDDLDKSYDECKFKVLYDSYYVKCTNCTEDCETEKTINTINLNEPFIIVCDDCETAFSSRENFLKHYTQIHIETDKNIICNDKKHKFKHSSQALCNVGQLSKYQNVYDKSRIKKTNAIWKCLICHIRFIRKDSLKKHFEAAHIELNCRFTQELDYSYLTEEISTENEQEVNESKNKMTKTTSCKICDAEFRYRSTKIAHMSREHGVKKSLECHYGCGFSTLKKDRFQAHLDKHENPDKTFDCPICNQAFKSYNSMTLHRARHTSKSVTFVCSFCSKTFLDRRNYNVHVRLHTKEKLFHCDKCQRGFNRKEHLKNHLNKKGQCDST